MPKCNPDHLFVEALGDIEEGATFVFGQGYLQISVSEEKAIDSYGESFTCSITMTVDKAEELLKWLQDGVNRHRGQKAKRNHWGSIETC